MTLTIDCDAAGRPVPPPARPVPLCVVTAAIWLGGVALLLALFAGRVADGVLWDPDDSMRIVQTLDWLDGAGWYDVTQERLNPPDGVAMHWSRLPDLPLAAMVAAGEPLVGRDKAVMLAAIAMPAAMLLGVLAVLGWAGRVVLGRTEAELAPFMAMFSFGLLSQFLPGRVDHHGWQLVLAAVALGCFVHALSRPDGRFLELAAIATGLGLWIGAEGVPWLFALSVTLWLRWVWLGHSVVIEGLRFAAALCVATAVLLALAFPPWQWLAVRCDGFSFASLGLGLTLLAFWAGAFVLGQRLQTPLSRAGLGLIPAAIAGAGFLLAFPECRGGPFSAVDPRLVALWMSHVREASPLFAEGGLSDGKAAMLLVGPVLGLAGAGRHAWRCRGPLQWAWIALVVYLALAIGLMFWQTRVFIFAHLFAVLPLAVLLKDGWRRADRFGMPALRLAGKAAWLALLSPLPAVLLSIQVHAMTAGDDAGASTAGAENAAGPETRRCPLDGLAVSLAPLRTAPGMPLTIAGFVDLGSDILLRTRSTGDGVLAAPYHRNGDGILDAMDLFHAADPALAREIAARRGVDVLMLCPRMGEMSLYGADSLAARLAGGWVPDWLHAVPAPAESGLLIFGVVLSGESGHADASP